MTRRAQQPWEAEDISIMRAMLKDRAPDWHIADILGRTVSSVSAKRSSLGMARGHAKTTSVAAMPDEESKQWEEDIDTQSYHFEVAQAKCGVRFDDMRDAA